MPQARLGEIELYYEKAGDGAPLVLIAGLASDSASWGPVAPALAQRFGLVMPDNRGSGRTKYGAKPFTIAEVADDVAGLLTQLGIERAHVLGHSMGGMIAATFAARHPQRIDKLVLAGSSAKRSPRAGAVMADLAALRQTNASPELRFRLFYHWLFAPKFFEDPEAVAAAARASATYPYAPTDEMSLHQGMAAATFDAGVLKDIRAETLTLSGALDLLSSPEDAAASLGVIANSRQTILDGAAHSLHWDQPDAFVAVVSDFLERG